MKQHIQNAFNTDVYRKYNNLCNEIREMDPGPEKIVCLQRFVKAIEQLSSIFFVTMSLSDD